MALSVDRGAQAFVAALSSGESIVCLVSPALEKQEYQKRVVELEPKREVVKYELANLYYRLRRYEEAEQLYREVLSIGPDFWSAYLQLFRLYVSWHGDLEKVKVEHHRKEDEGCISMRIKFPSCTGAKREISMR